MKTKILVLVLVIVSSVTFAQRPNSAGEARDGKVRMMKHQMMRNKAKADFLTEEQKEFMKKSRLEMAQQIKPLKNELHELHAHQQTLTTANNADLKAINKNIDKISEAKAEMAKIMAKHQQELRSQLTPEQLIKFDNIKNHRKQQGKGQFRKNNMQKRGA